MEEAVKETNSELNEQAARERQNKKQRMLTQKLENVRRNPLYSIVLFYNQYESYVPVRVADRIIRALKKRITSGRITAQEVIDVLKQYSQALNKYWQQLAEIYPGMMGSTPAMWSSLNEPLHERQMLANRMNTFVFIPRSDETAQMAIFVKKLREAAIHFQNDLGHESLLKVEKVRQFEQQFAQELKELNQSMEEKFSIVP